MIFFSSDQHFWHANVIKYCKRPYSSIEEMNEDLINKWNSIVRPDDEVYCLGDFSMAFRSVEVYTSRLMGKKYLVPGNHDMLHSYHKKSRNPENRAKWTQKYIDNGWIVLPEKTTLEVQGFDTFNMCHHPYSTPFSIEDEGYNDKYRDWRPEDNGKTLLCGHVHEKWDVRKTPKGTLMINVGVDVHNMTPISLDQIINIVKSNT